MDLKTIKVSEKGQIAIPQSVRDNADIEKGDELFIIQMNGKILLEKVSKLAIKMKDDFRDLLRFSEQALKDIWDNKQDDIWNTYLKK